MAPKKPIVLCILDGWGIGEKSDYNAIENANPTFYKYLLKNYPHSKLHTSGKYVGLPDGQMGNSEVGHITIGSGRIIEQDLVKITRFLNTLPLKENKVLEKILLNESTCHLVGLLSDGGVHSHIDHVEKIIDKMLLANKKVCLHIITDGRDTPPKSAEKYLQQMEKYIGNKNFTIGSISGRYYAMDRDQRHDRTLLALNAIIKSNKEEFLDPKKVISNSYAKGEIDEFILPSSNALYQGVKTGDDFLFFNFRPDRMRQIVSALYSKLGGKISIYTMTNYSEDISKFSEVIFLKDEIKNTLGEIISKTGFKQLRVAETEKYPHVTYFFNGGNESKFTNEDRILVESPKVTTYDICPEMSAKKVTNSIVKNAHLYDFILVNYANTDMVGHTGNYNATKKAVKFVDECLENIYMEIVKKLDGKLIITADHGNAEKMYDKRNQQTLTSHTTNPVPFIIASNEKNFSIRDGGLEDISPTILRLFNLEAPELMTGKNLIEVN